jgi:hypothetical protein
MIKSIRQQFNASFSQEKYENFLLDLNSAHPDAIDFRIAETPVFIEKKLGQEMIQTCESIIDFITDPKFNSLTERAIPTDEMVQHQNKICHFIAFDFGICENETGGFFPALIEMQGFPTLFGMQAYYPEVLERHFKIPDGFSHYFNGLNKASYLSLLQRVIIGEHKAEEVILLEIQPHQQKTRIDFYCTEDYLGIAPVCITELIKEGGALYYNRNGAKTRIKRIYNRIIADELNAVKDSLGLIVDLRDDLDVEWVPHPNWFYRISKFTLPFLHHPFIPQTFFLNEVESIPEDLHNYVLKPLFSFAGQGVVIDVTKADIEAIQHPEHWILQRKVKYASCIQTPNEPAKAEVRLMYVWEEGKERPILATNLARLSKGKMIGVRYNKDKDWVGGSVAYFEQ